MTDKSIEHTDGPWEMREDDEGRFAIAHAKGWVFESDSVDQDRADYRLAAAAPDLLAALKALSAEFVRVYPIYYYAEPWAHNRNVPLAQARAAIARTEGGKQVCRAVQP